MALVFLGGGPLDGLYAGLGFVRRSGSFFFVCKKWRQMGFGGYTIHHYSAVLRRVAFTPRCRGRCCFRIVFGKEMHHARGFLLHACCLFPTTSFARRLESACGLALASSVTFRSIRPQAVAHFPSCASSSQQVHSFTSMNRICSDLVLSPAFSERSLRRGRMGFELREDGRGSS